MISINAIQFLTCLHIFPLTLSKWTSTRSFSISPILFSLLVSPSELRIKFLLSNPYLPDVGCYFFNIFLKKKKMLPCNPNKIVKTLCFISSVPPEQPRNKLKKKKKSIKYSQVSHPSLKNSVMELMNKIHLKKKSTV